MDGEAREVRFQDLIDEELLHVNDGYRAKHSELGIGGPIFLRAVHLQDGGFDFDGVQYFQDDARERVTGKMAMPGDTVVTTKGNSTGRTGYVSESMPPFVYSPHLSFWRSLDHSELKPLFLRYWARGPEFRDQLNGLKESTDMAPYLSLTDQRRLRITLPSPRTQEAVGNLLGALDDKIEANRALNETLEATCQALFRSWFVDFDPVVAKSEGRRPPHLTDDVAALFPDRFEGSPLGPVPAGWRVGTVGEEYDLTMGQSPPGSTYNEDGIGLPFYQGRTDFRERYPVRRVYCTAPTRLAEEGETLVSVRAPVGDTNQALEQCALGRGVGAVRHKLGKTSFTYYQMGALRDEFDVYNGYGTLFGSINKGDFSKLPIVVPPAHVVDRFEGVAGRMDATFRANIMEQQTLEILRDALLPRLLSGELRVRQAEQLVEEAI